MPAKARTQTRETAAEKPVAEVAGKAMRNYEQALRTGLKFQEEAGNWWSNMLSHATTASELQKRFANFTSLASGLMPMTQRRLEEVMEVMEKNSRTGAELVRKAVDAVQTPSLPESQAKWMEFWTSSLRAAQANTEALAHINARILDSWIDFVRKNTEMTEMRVPRMA
jgi:hypothetical protein